MPEYIRRWKSPPKKEAGLRDDIPVPYPKTEVEVRNCEFHNLEKVTDKTDTTQGKENVLAYFEDLDSGKHTDETDETSQNSISSSSSASNLKEYDPRTRFQEILELVETVGPDLPPKLDDITARTLNRLGGWSTFCDKAKLSTDVDNLKTSFIALYNEFLAGKKRGIYSHDKLPYTYSNDRIIFAERIPSPRSPTNTLTDNRSFLRKLDSFKIGFWIEAGDAKIQYHSETGTIPPDLAKEITANNELLLRHCQLNERETKFIKDLNEVFGGLKIKLIGFLTTSPTLVFLVHLDLYPGENIVFAEDSLETKDIDILLPKISKVIYREKLLIELIKKKFDPKKLTAIHRSIRSSDGGD